MVQDFIDAGGQMMRALLLPRSPLFVQRVPLDPPQRYASTVPAQYF